MAAAFLNLKTAIDGHTHNPAWLCADPSAMHNDAGPAFLPLRSAVLPHFWSELFADLVQLLLTQLPEPLEQK